MRKYSSFTLMEILIVVALLALIATAAIVFIDPIKQINRGFDAQRKHDLDLMKKKFEDFYNDKGCYPKPSEVCYLGGDNGPTNPMTKNPCNICGKEATSPSFKPYLDTLPCDPKHPQKDYSYQVDNTSCPSWFKIYAKFDTFDDPQSSFVGCGKGGCGPTNNYGYDYGVGSSNINIHTSTIFNCYTTSKTCDNCGSSPQECDNRPTCTDRIYGTFTICCQYNPSALGCPH